MQTLVTQCEAYNFLCSKMLSLIAKQFTSLSYFLAIKRGLWAIIAILAICVPSVYSLAVMSVDLGTEWMKVAVVSVSNFEF